MTNKEIYYKLSLSGGDITISNRQITEEVARRVINLVMMNDTVKFSAQSYEKDPEVTVNDFGGDNLMNDDINPKIFMAEKKPSSEVERITCLAFYLMRYRNLNAFKTKDLTNLNRDAAQPSFSNPAVFARNAVSRGYLSKAGGGSKQISILGEKIIEALPDREAVKKAIEEYGLKRKRRIKKSGTKKIRK